MNPQTLKHLKMWRQWPYAANWTGSLCCVLDQDALNKAPLHSGVPRWGCMGREKYSNLINLTETDQG